MARTVLQYGSESPRSRLPTAMVVRPASWASDSWERFWLSRSWRRISPSLGSGPEAAMSETLPTSHAQHNIWPLIYIS